jgi:hypothetical protein
MKNFPPIHHLTGDQAYLVYWLVVYDCQVRISSIEAIDQNLEIIVNDEGDLLAYRYDHPIEMSGMVVGDGEWHVYNSEGLSNNDRIYLQKYNQFLRVWKFEVN